MYFYRLLEEKTMSMQRIKGILLQEFFITRRSLEILIDLFYWAIIGVIVFGFVSLYLVSGTDSTVAQNIFLGILLWEIIRVTQYTVSVGCLSEIWSKNLSNMFISPLSIKEYIVAQLISASIKSALVFLLASFVAIIVFNFNVFAIGFLNMLFSFINLTVFAWSVGIAILGLIFRYGTRIQSFAWSLIFLFQPLTANLYPVSILPEALRTFAYTLPPTYVFESARRALADPSVDWNLAALAFAENVIYFILSLVFFNFMFRKSKDSGQFARNEG